MLLRVVQENLHSLGIKFPVTLFVTVGRRSPDMIDNSYGTDGTITLSGTAEESTAEGGNVTVQVYEEGTPQGTPAQVDSSGAWSVTVTGVGDDSHTFKVKATDAAGNISGESNARTVTVDTIKPETLMGDRTRKSWKNLPFEGCAPPGGRVTVPSWRCERQDVLPALWALQGHQLFLSEKVNPERLLAQTWSTRPVDLYSVSLRRRSMP